MAHFLTDYLLFLTKTLTWIIALLILFAGIIAIAGKGKTKNKEKLEITHLNEKLQKLKNHLQQVLLDKKEYKKLLKQEKSAIKAASSATKKKVFVINFKGDIKASAVRQLREEVTAVLTVAAPVDEVVIRLESAGGMMHAYGLAASQLQRFRQRAIKSTVIIDQIAASGGYMMACVADQIIAAPFAIVGSIGVIAQLPNFNRLLKKNDVDFEQITAGEYKRTLTLFAENTEKGRQKFQEEVNDAHALFKNFIIENRPQLDMQQVATGEHWYGIRALERQLVDKLQTSDDYLLEVSQHAEVYEVCYTIRKSMADKLALTAQATLEKVITGWRQEKNSNFIET